VLNCSRDKIVPGKKPKNDTFGPVVPQVRGMFTAAPVSVPVVHLLPDG